METENIGNGTLEHWTPKEVQNALDRNEIVLIDVRTPQEFVFERIAKALLAPMQSFDPTAMPAQEGKRIVLHCGSGARSKKMAERMIEAGTDRIAHMKGGFGAWKEDGLTYIGTEMSSGAPKEMRKDG